MFASILSRDWWITLLRGVLWILFGVIVFTQPAISLLTLTLLFGAFALADGISAVVMSLRGRDEHESWWMVLLVGLCGIGVGVLTLLAPGITALVLLFYIAFWTIGTGLLQMLAAFQLRKDIEGELWLALSGLVSVVFGSLLLARPGAGALAVLWLIGFYAVALGVALVLLAFRVRRFARRLSEGVF